jgi:hypothetical protein
MIKKELNYDQVCHLTGTNFALRVLILTENYRVLTRPGLYSAFPGLSINPRLSLEVNSRERDYCVT